MHTDRQELSVWRSRLSAAGDGHRYAHPGNFSQDETKKKTKRVPRGRKPDSVVAELFFS